MLPLSYRKNLVSLFPLWLKVYPVGLQVDIDKPTGLSLGEGKGKGGGLVIKVPLLVLA